MPISATTHVLRRLAQWGSSMLLVFGLALSPALAQQGTGTIQGNVYDDTESPLGGANVTVLGEDLSATTNSNGFFQISNVPAGTQTVQADAFGYQSDSTTVSLSPDDTTFVSFFLQPAQPEITVTPPEVLDFGGVPVGSAATDDVVIENTGEVDVDIFNLFTDAGEGGEQGFVIVSGGEETTLSPGETHTVTIEFTPATSGFKGEDLVIDYSPENRRRVDLRGIGIVPPTATTTGASSVTATSAALNGSVDTGGGETNVSFEYGLANEGLSESVVADDSPILESQSVRAVIDGLEPATEYVFRVVATNEAGSDTGEEETFTTDAAPPSAQTEAASEVTTDSAVLNGRVDPNGATTTVTFEYGLTTDYGNTITAEQSPLSGTNDQAVSAAISGLEPGATYHYRVVAENSLGSTNSGNRMFTTSAPVLEVNPGEVSFSEVGLGNSSDPQEITIENTGDAPLSIVSVTLGDTTNFKKRDDTGETNLAPGATRTMTLTFVPQSSGTKATELVVESETAGTSAVSISGIGVQLGITLVPDTLDLGTVAVGDEATGEVTVENTGEGTLEIAGVSLSGADAGDFAITSGGGSGTLEPGATRAVSLRFTPSREGSRSATMTVESNADPASAELRGTGEAVSPTATTQAATSVRTMSATVNGRVHPGGGSTTVTFEYEPASGGSMQTIEADQSPVTGDENVDVSADIEGLEPGTEYTFRVVANNSAGSDTGENRSFTTLAPELSVTPSSLDFGRAAVDDTTTRQVTLENTGDADLEITSISIAGSNAEAFSTVGSGPGGILPGQEQALAIRFIPSNGGTKTAQLTIESNAGSSSVDLAGEGVAVEVDPPEVDPTSGEPHEVVGSIPESFQPTERTLYYRRGGERSYQSVELGLEEGGRVTGSIPASAVTPRGIDFYVELSDGEFTVTAPSARPVANPFHLRTQFEGLEAADEFAPQAYRMVSVPAAMEASDVGSVFSAYGALNPSQWRLLRWNPSVGDYREGTEIGPVAPGRAFWLITRSGRSFSVSGRSVDASGPFSITLEPGYNQIASPFAFPVAWSQVDMPAGVDAPRAAFPPHNGVSVLEPWSGYWVFNRNSTSVQIAIPPVEATGAAGTAARPKQGNGSALPFAERPTYALQLMAQFDRSGTRDRSASQSLRDRYNYVGWAEGATGGFGAEDVPEVPPIGEHVRLSIVEDGMPLSGSLRPFSSDGQAWNIEVAAHVNEPFTLRKTVRVRLHEHGTRPSGYQLQLIDTDNGRTIPIRDHQFEVTLTSEQPTRHLRLAMGTARFTEQEAAEVVPRTTALGPSYPNPAAGPTSIDYQLEEARYVQVAVYDMLGRRVKTLVDGNRPAGTHTARWDGRRSSGAPAASGVYVIRMQAGSFTATRRLVIIR